MNLFERVSASFCKDDLIDPACHHAQDASLKELWLH